MSRRGNKDADSLRNRYFFCLECQVRREAVDEGETFPVCAACGKRRLEARYETNAAQRLPDSPLIPDERPPEAAPLVQAKTKPNTGAFALEVLTQLVTDFPSAVGNPETYHALLTGAFNPFVRELVNIMVIERVDWRAAASMVSKEFSLRYSQWLEEFMVWAPEPSGVPSFITEPTAREPLTHHDPLPATNPGTGSD